MDEHTAQLSGAETSSLLKILHQAGSISAKSQDQAKIIRVQQEIDRQKQLSKKVLPQPQQVVREVVVGGQNLAASQSSVVQNTKAKLQGQGQVTIQTQGSSTTNLLQKNKLNLNKKPPSIGQYTIGEIIGRGAHGKVYKATDASGKTVAVKLFSNFKTDLKSQISQEISLLKKLDHPNIVKYIDFVQKDRQIAIVLEFVDCGSLQDLIKRHGGCFTETIVAVYIKQVLRGLEYLHGRNVIHRDIKGANILTTKEGVVKVADFGVATKLDDEVSSNKNPSNAFAGTPYWMAPEVIEMQENITTACDIWSLGCTVFELLKGSPPNFDLNQFSAMIKIVKDAGSFPLPDNISPELTNFLNLCFLRNPEERPSATQLLDHLWLKKMSNQQKLGKIMSLKLPQEVTNTIRVHLRKQYEQDANGSSASTQPPINYSAGTAVDAPHTTIEVQENSSMRVLSPSTLVEDKQAIANIVKQQQFQSRNQNLNKHSLTTAAQVEIHPLQLGTQESVGQNSHSGKPNVVLAQKNLIKLQTQRQLQDRQSSNNQKSPKAQPKRQNFIDLRGQTTTPQSALIANNKIGNAHGDLAEDLLAPESQQVTEHHPVDDSSPNKEQLDSFQHRSFPSHQVVNIQLKSNGQATAGSRNRSKVNEVQNSSLNSKTARETPAQWQTTVSGSGLQKKESELSVRFQPTSSNTAFSKQFYSATAAPNSIQEDYPTAVGQQRHVPILADHSVQYFNNNRSPQNSIVAKHSQSNLPHNHSQNSQDFSKGILSIKQTLMPDQQLHIYTQQVPKKSPLVVSSSAPNSQKNHQLPYTQPKTTPNESSQINYQLQQSKPLNEFSKHSSLIARKPNSGQQARLSSQTPLNVPLSKDPNLKLQLFNKTNTPVGVNLQSMLAGGTPLQQSQLSSALQTYEQLSSDQKVILQHQRSMGTRTALSTLSASSYPTQPLLQNSSEQIIAIHHPQHKSLALIQQKKQSTPQMRQRSPTNPPKMIRTGFAASTGRDLQYLGDDLETQIKSYTNVRLEQNNLDDFPAEGEVDDQSSDHELLFTQVLERSMGRRPSQNSISNTNHQTTRAASALDFKKFGKQEQIALASSIAKDLRDQTKNQDQVLQRAYQLMKEISFQTHFKEHLIKEIGFVDLVQYTEQYPLQTLQLINQVCEAQPQFLIQFCQAGIMAVLKSLAQLNDRKLKVEVAFFVAQIFEDAVQSSVDLISIFLSSGCLEILIRFLALDYKTDKDLIMISIDSILVMLDKRRKQNFLSNQDLSKLLIKANLLEVLTNLVPRLIRHAENQYRHGNSILNESETDTNEMLKEQSNAERYLERAFDLLNLVCQASNEVRLAVVNSEFLAQHTVQECIYECLHEPSAITFQLTKWFIKVISLCCTQVSEPGTNSEVSKLNSYDIELLLLEMLSFYMGLVGHIQLASIYDNLKLLLTFIRGNAASVRKTVEYGILPKLKSVCDHLEQHEKSRTKRCKLFQVSCQIWTEICQAGHLKELKDFKVDQFCLRILQSQVLQTKPSQKEQADELAEKVLGLFQAWQLQDRLIEYLVAENLKIFLLVDQPTMFSQIVKRSQILTKAVTYQKNLSLLLQMHQRCQDDQKPYYEILLHLKSQGLNIQNYAQYIKPPSDWNDSQQRQLYQLLSNDGSLNNETYKSIDQTSQLQSSSNSANTDSLLFS